MAIAFFVVGITPFIEFRMFNKVKSFDASHARTHTPGARLLVHRRRSSSPPRPPDGYCLFICSLRAVPNETRQRRRIHQIALLSSTIIVVIIILSYCIVLTTTFMAIGKYCSNSVERRASRKLNVCVVRWIDFAGCSSDEIATMMILSLLGKLYCDLWFNECRSFNFLRSFQLALSVARFPSFSVRNSVFVFGSGRPDSQRCCRQCHLKFKDKETFCSHVQCCEGSICN